MQSINKNNIRNIAVCAHVDAGKTTITERILFYSGKIHRMGEVHDGNTVMDSDRQEKARGITINAAATTFSWKTNTKECQINLIDSPGHCDFGMEVERSLRVLDGAICVLDGSQGVEPQTEQVWRQADKYNVSRIIFINKMDKTGADFEMSLSSIKERLGVKAVAIQLPCGEEGNFSGMIDLVDMKMFTYDDKFLGKEYKIEDISSSFIEKSSSMRLKMIESLAEFDDNICEKFLNDRTSEITSQEIRQALRQGTISRIIFPVLCGSALKNKGVQMLLDSVVHYLPSPTDLDIVMGLHPKTLENVSRKLIDEEPLSALAFKIVSDKNGDLTFVRIYSGVIKSGTSIYNSTRHSYERVSKVSLVHADSKKEIEISGAGTIVALSGLKNTYTGDTLCHQNSPILLEKMDFPNPVVELLIEPKTNADQDKLSTSLQKLLLEDPSLKVSTDEETAQTILKGMGELHLEIIVDRLRNDHHVNVNTGKPRVSYKETVLKIGYGEHKHAKQTGGRGQYGHVVLNVAPTARGTGFIFKSEVVGGTIPKEYIPSIEKGIKGAMEKGVLAGYPVVDVEVCVTDGSYHAVDSSTTAFEIAGSIAFQQAAKNAGLVILEPIMSLEVVSPEEYMGDVIGSITSRAGNINDTSFRGNARVIDASIPLRTVFGYTSDLRSRTQGRAVPSMMFSHYEVCNLKPSDLDK